jgi:fumarate hydratase class II/high-affinity iron transporter
MHAHRPPIRQIAETVRSGARGGRGTALAVLALALVLGMAASPGASAGTFSWNTVAEETIAALNEASLHHAEGDIAQCKRAITRAYFGVFEEQKMEAAMRKMLGESHAFMVERQFSTLRRNVATATPADFARTVATLAEQLRADARQLDALGVPQEVYNAR